MFTWPFFICAVARITNALGLEKPMFEAADPEVFSWYIKNYGAEVNLFVDHSQIVQLECLLGHLGHQESLGPDPHIQMLSGARLQTPLAKRTKRRIYQLKLASVVWRRRSALIHVRRPQVKRTSASLKPMSTMISPRPVIHALGWPQHIATHSYYDTITPLPKIVNQAKAG